MGVLGDAALHRALDQWVDARLGAPQRPRSFSFGEALPRDGAGKLADWMVPEAG